MQNGLYKPSQGCREVEYTIAALDRWDKINAGHHVEKRAAERKSYSGRPTLAVTTPVHSDAGQHLAKIYFQVWARNVSRSGVCLIFPENIPPLSKHPDGKSDVDLSGIIHVELGCNLGLPLLEDRVVWFESRVVRVRHVHAEMVEIGLAFKRRMRRVQSR